jgi:hypothetical protein
VLADFGIVLGDLHFARHGLLVLGGRVEVARTSGRLKLDLFAHDWNSLSDFAACAQISEHNVDTVFVDRAQTGCGNTQAHPMVFAFNPETTILQIREKTALRSIVGMGNVVPYHRALARYLADSRHD